MDFESLHGGFTRRDWQTVTDIEPVRFATIGLGWWTRNEAIPAFEQSDLATMTVGVSRSAENANALADDHDMIERGISVEEFHDGVAADEYDAVYICTPNATHPDLVTTAAALGKDVLCEKPMAATSDGAREMVEFCDEHGVTLMIAYRMQTEPAVRRAREFIREGVIGDPIQVHGHMSDRVPDLFPDPDHWRLDPSLSGGATLIDIGLYPLNTTRFLLDADPTEGYAETFADHEWFEGLDEHVTFSVTFGESVSGAFTVSHNAHPSSHLQVIGSEGEVRLEPAFFTDEDRRLRVTTEEANSTIEFDQVNQMVEEFDYVAHCIRTGTEPVPNGRHGLRDIEVMEALYRSAETGARVDLP